MAEAGGHLWITQADSDLYAAALVYRKDEPRTYCQAIAKYQQCVEKSIKALAAAMLSRFVISIPIGYKHPVAKIASALRRPARPRDVTDIQHYINKALTEYWIKEIEALDAFAPRRPAHGALHARNTEYPFETIAGSWTAPASAESFGVTDVARFKVLAERLHFNAKEIVSALRR